MQPALPGHRLPRRQAALRRLRGGQLRSRRARERRRCRTTDGADVYGQRSRRRAVELADGALAV